MTLVRLQKYLAECGVASRRRSEDLIRSKKVSVNGVVVSTLGTKIDPANDSVAVQGKVINLQEKGVAILNKPVGVVSTRKDPEGRKTVMDLLPKELSSYYPVGRLDYDTSGLLLMTNNGELAYQLTHPKFEVERVYLAKVEGLVERKTLDQIRRGVELDDGPIAGEAKEVRSDGGNSIVEIRLKEGRNRIVRRLMDHLGHPVISLHRTAHGAFRLNDIGEGEVEILTELPSNVV